MWWRLSGPQNAVQRGQVHATDYLPPFRVKGRKPRSRKTVPTVCGLQRASLWVATAVTPTGEPAGTITTPWPPYATDAKSEGLERCPDCLRLAPGKPQRIGRKSA